MYLKLQSAKYAAKLRDEVVITAVSACKVPNSETGQKTSVKVVIIHELFISWDAILKMDIIYMLHDMRLCVEMLFTVLCDRYIQFVHKYGRVGIPVTGLEDP